LPERRPKLQEELVKLKRKLLKSRKDVKPQQREKLREKHVKLNIRLLKRRGVSKL